MITQPPEPAAEQLLEIADALLPGHRLDDARITAGNDGRPLTNVEGFVRSIVAWLEKDA
ncbi:hypothetical protein GCM10023334_112030 [Nonomuraea thailandensis]